MTRDVVCVAADASMDALEGHLLGHDVSGVPVIDAQRRLVGYVAMTDVVRGLHERRDAGKQPVAEQMSPVAFELHESSAVAKALEMMTTRQVHRIPVISEDRVLVGVVTAADLLRFLSGGDVRIDRTTEADRAVSLGFLANGLAHQINNALTPMRLSLGRLTSFELSRRPMSPEGMHRVELLQDLREGLERIGRIVRELDVFSQVGDAPSAPVDLADVIEAAISVAGHEIRHRARLVRDYNPTPRVDARAADLRQMVLSLLVNAIQAIPEGEAHIHEIKVTTWTDRDGHANLEVRDTGAGIPADKLPRVFEPFFTTRRGTRLGLGLAVARDVVNALGGTISAESVVGSGTAIRIALPPSDVRAPRAERFDEPSPGRESSHGLRVLIVDDDRPVAAAIALELRQHDVMVAESGREALEILRHDKGFDVILCDLMMPEISGMDVYEALRLIDPGLLPRVVMMTGGAFTHRAGEFLATTEAPVLEKPFEPGQLQEVVAALDRHRDLADRPVPPTDGEPRHERHRRES